MLFLAGLALPVRGADLTDSSQAPGLQVILLIEDMLGDIWEGFECGEWVSSGYGRCVPAACELIAGLPVDTGGFLMHLLLFDASCDLPSETLTAGMYR